MFLITTPSGLINNNNGFRVRFGVRRRHRGPPFALGYYQFIIIVAIQDEGEGEGGTLAGSVIPCICPDFRKTMVGKGVFLKRKETRARLGRIEVAGEENSKWMGQQTKKSVDRLPTEYRCWIWLDK